MKQLFFKILLPIMVIFFHLNSYSQYSLESKFGSDGTGNGQFTSPQGVGLDATGNVYVSDAFGGNDRIQKFSSSGIYLSTIGSSGTGNGQLSAPQSIAIDASGNIFVSEYFNNRIQKFNSSGVFQTTFGNSAYGLAIDASSNINITDYSNNEIKKYSNTGSYISTFGSAGTGNGQFANPWGIAIDNSGNIFIVDSGNNRIQKFNSSGTYLAQFGSLGTGNGQFNNPTSIAIDASNNLYVIDYNNKRVQVFNNSGTYLYQFNISYLENPNAIAINSSTKKIYISNDYTSNRHIAILAPSPKIYISENNNSIANGSGNYAFGDIMGGTSSQVTVTIKNTGLTNLTISGINKTSGSSDFAINSSATSLSVTPSNTTTFTITFTPTSKGNKSAIFTVTSNDPDVANYTFSVSGNGLFPEIVVKENSNTIVNGTGTYNFGNIQAGQAPSVSITLSNTGNANLSISSITRTSGSSDFSINTSGTLLNLSTNQSTTFTITFTPTSKGNKSAIFKVTSNDPNTPNYTFSVSGNGLVPEIIVKENSTTIVNGTGSYDFGNVSAGPAQSVSINISNSGNANLSISSITKVSGSSDFSINTSGTSLNLAPNQSTTFQITFTPSATGAKSAVISISSNDANFASYTFNVTGNVIVTDVLSSSNNVELVKVFPNPTDGIVHIDMNDLTDITQINIKNIAGQEIYSVSGINKELTVDLNSEKEGLYVIEFIHINGQKKYKKIILK